MADLSTTDAKLETAIVGTDANGVSTHAVGADAEGELLVSDILQGSGIQNAINVGLTPVLANVTGTNLVNRKLLTISHNGNGLLYWGFNNTVTITTGTQIFKNTMLSIDCSQNTNIYLIATTATNDVRISECA